MKNYIILVFSLISFLNIYSQSKKQKDKDAIKKMWIDTPRGNKFMNNVVKRFDKKNVQLTKLEKASIEKSIKEIDDQIVQANKSNDILKIRELSLQKDSLLATHTGLKINYLNNYTKALVRNEAYASAIGGTLYSLFESDGLFPLSIVAPIVM